MLIPTIVNTTGQCTIITSGATRCATWYILKVICGTGINIVRSFNNLDIYAIDTLRSGISNFLSRIPTSSVNTDFPAPSFLVHRGCEKFTPRQPFNFLNRGCRSVPRKCFLYIFYGLCIFPPCFTYFFIPNNIFIFNMDGYFYRRNSTSNKFWKSKNSCCSSYTCRKERSPAAPILTIMDITVLPWRLNSPVST